MPCTPMFLRTFFTSSSLNGFTTATTSFIVVSSDPPGPRGPHRAR